MFTINLGNGKYLGRKPKWNHFIYQSDGICDYWKNQQENQDIYDLFKAPEIQEVELKQAVLWNNKPTNLINLIQTWWKDAYIEEFTIISKGKV